MFNDTEIEIEKKGRKSWWRFTARGVAAMGVAALGVCLALGLVTAWLFVGGATF